MARISEQPVAQPLTGSEELIAVQDDGNVKLTPAGLLKYGNQNILSGRITKTIAHSNGDFVSFDELFGWIRSTPMISVDLTVIIQDGTYNISDAIGGEPTTHTLLGSQLTKIHFIGANTHACILNINNSIPSRGFIKTTNLYLGMSRLTINNIGQSAFLADVTSSTLNLNDIVISDVEYMFTANRSHCEINNCDVTCTSTGLHIRESSTLELGGGIIDGGGVAGVGINCTNNCTIVGNNNPSVRNCTTGLAINGTSRVMLATYDFSGNGANFNVPINLFQGDGGYITDGNLDISGSSDAFELIANKNQPDGYAGLDSGGKIPEALLPDIYDEVYEFGNLAAFPAMGESATLYIAVDTGILYRWAQVQTSPGTWANQYINITDAGYFE